MFNRVNFKTFEMAIAEISTKVNEDGTISIKPGLKHNLYYLIKTTVTIIKGMYLILGAKCMNNFLELLNLRKSDNFGDAQYQLQQNRMANSRRPSSLPLEEDMSSLRNYMLHRLETLSVTPVESITIHNYVELRNLLVARLTLFNGRRGGEPARLLVKEYNDAFVVRHTPVE